MLPDLNQDELNALADLLVISQKAKAREAICIKIGISYYNELAFIYESSDYSFAINLINHLNEIGNTKAICQLCCKELSPIFQGERKSFLKEIAVKLNCNHDLGQNYQKKKTSEQPTSPRPSPSNQLDELKPESWFTKIGNVNKKLFTIGAILIVGLAGFAIHGQIRPNVDPKYSNLQEFLKARNWEEADNETFTITRKILARDKADPVYINNVNTFPCSDLLTIDQLWLEYSDNRFGFSKQKQILSNLLVTETKQQEKEDYAWKEFSNQVSWNRKVISEQNAPDGHFPAIGTWWSAYQPGWLEALFSRADACKADKNHAN